MGNCMLKAVFKLIKPYHGHLRFILYIFSQRVTHLILLSYYMVVFFFLCKKYITSGDFDGYVHFFQAYVENPTYSHFPSSTNYRICTDYSQNSSA